MKKINSIITLGAISLIFLTGCTNNTKPVISEQNTLNISDISNIKIPNHTQFETEGDLDEYSFKKVKGYNNLKAFVMEGDIRNSKHIELSSYTSTPSYSYDTADKIKSLLGENIKLTLDNFNIFPNPDIYFLKGYEDTDKDAIEKRCIYLALQEEFSEEYGNPPYEKIGFEASSSSSEIALKKMLSMEDKISTMLNNLLKKDESKEVLRFLKEEIARNASLPNNESSFTIDINSDIYLEYVYTYSENLGLYYNRLSLCSYCPMAKVMEQIDEQYK